MRRSLSLIGVLLALSTGVAHGKECLGASFSEQVQVDGGTLTLNGVGARKATMVNLLVYVAALYVPKSSSDGNAILGSGLPYQLVLEFMRNVSASDISNGWDQGFAKNAKQLPALKERIATLNGWMADLKAGERLTFSFQPASGMQVNVNGSVKGTIQGDDFGKSFLSIVLGADPPNPELKAGLLGGVCE